MSGNPAIRAVIFDMDGVLTDFEPLINAGGIAVVCDTLSATLPISKWRLGPRHPMRLGNGFVGELPIHHVDAAHEGRLEVAGFGQAGIGEQFDVAVSDIRERLGAVRA